MRLGVGDLRRVDGAVEKVENLIADEDVLVPFAGPDRVGQHPDADIPASELSEQLGYIGIGVGVWLPEVTKRRMAATS